MEIWQQQIHIRGNINGITYWNSDAVIAIGSLVGKKDFAEFSKKKEKSFLF